MIQKSVVKNILVVGHSNIGDCVMSLPVLSVLRAEFPEAGISLITGRSAISLFQGCRDIQSIFVYDKKWGWREKWRWLGEIAKNKYDLIVDLRHTLIPVLLPSRYRTRLVRWKSQQSLPAREKHLRLLSDLGLNIANQKPIHLFGETEKQSVQKILSRKGFISRSSYIVIAPGANSSTKQWPLEYFQEIARFCVAQLQESVVIAGGKNEENISRQMEEWSKSSGVPIFNLIGETSLRELAALLAGAKVVMANDSAVLHLASELDVPVAAIFGPTNAAKYAKLNGRTKVIRLALECSPCESAQCLIERRKCLEDLKPDLVKQAMKELCHSHEPIH
ncbi:MAG: glycosyltransferase family 9 protein [Candidatus Omnitrophica bacterium]|nr:glycosyltransferase family 9 protein [Candidatus Omnitrophota bacterium]